MDGAECIERKLHDCKQNEQGMTKQDLEEIIQRIGALEAQINRKKDNSDNAAITGKDNGTNIGFRDKVRRKPTKSASFNGRSTSKSRRRSPYRHTVPSDKDETTRIEEFRTECISKAIKSNTVDIVSSYTRKENPVIFLLPLWLSENDITLLKRKTCLKYKCRTFLVLLREKRFDTIRRWIQEESRLEETVTNHIWETFEEFNDTELILQRMCTFCKLKLKVDVSDIIDHLCSIEMISDALYTEINASDKTVGLQNELWLKVANQCKSFPIQGYVTEALRIALADCLESVENDTGKDVINEIVTELANVNGTACDFFECKCNAICSRELQPVSLIKSISLVNVYKSSQTKRKSVSNGSEPKDAGIVRDKREIETSNSSSTSSNESIASNLKMKSLQFVDNETMESESLDDRFISLQKSNRNQFIKRRGNKSKESKYNNKESLHREKSLSTASDNGIDVAQSHVNDTDGDTLYNRTFDDRSGSKYPLSKTNAIQGSYGTEMDTTLSSDNDEHLVKYRDKTCQIFRQLTNAKEKRNIKINIIKPSQVNIESKQNTLRTHSRHAAIESASD